MINLLYYPNSSEGGRNRRNSKSEGGPNTMEDAEE